MDPKDPSSREDTPKFSTKSATAEDMLKSSTVGLVRLSDFRKRRAEAFEQKEKETHEKSLALKERHRLQQGSAAAKETGEDNGTFSSDRHDAEPPVKKKKKKDLKGKDSWKLSARTRLPYMDDDDEDDEEDATRREGRAKDIAPKKSGTGTGTTSGDISEDATASGSGNDEASVSSKARRRGIEANPKITHPPPKLLTKSALKEEERARDHLRKEFYALQERIKATEIAVPFIFYDGTQIPGGMVKVKKGDPIWLFLDRCRKVGARMNIGGANGKRIYRRGWARVSVDDLMLVRKNVIIPHHYEFYYFIANHVPDFSESDRLLFDYTDRAAPPAVASGLAEPHLANSESNKQSGRAATNKDAVDESQLEGADTDPTLTKVIDRRWYERNKHIFPASLWREYKPGKEFEDEMKGVRRDNKGNAFFF